MGGRDGIGGAVPVASRKVVMSLKEVVNRSDSEIYATLVECNMDPDEAVNRLLSQDTFHEVKSKRDKKKETKDTLDSWSQGVGNIQNRKARNGSDYYSGRGGGNKFNSNETGNVQGKPTNRRENGTRNHFVGSSTVSGVLGRQPPSNSYPTNAEIKKAPMGPGDAVSSSPVPSSRYHQSSWGGNSGQRTMADIVKMGRPLTQNTKLPEALVSSKEIGTKAPFKDEFPSIEKPDMTTKVSAEPTMHTGPFSESNVRTEQVLEDFVTENHPVGYPEADHVWSASVSNHNLHNDESGDTLLCDDENNKNSETYQTQRQPIEHDETKDPSASVVTSIQKLSVDNEEEEDEPVVIIPNHLQIHTPECSHLMFGSFGSGMGSGQASGLTSDSFNEESPEVADTRNPEFYGEEEHLRNAPNEQLSYQIDSNPRNYHSSSDAETEQPPQHENPEPAQENQYKFSSTTDYTFESTQQLNPTLAPSNTTPQIQSFNTLPNVMDVREQDLQYLPFPYNQSIPTKHTTAASSLGGPAISMAEALRAASISGGPQSNQQAMADAALAQQHLPMNPYSQHTLPLGHYANMISYPFMPQSYPYMPSAFQQTYPNNNTYHQSLAAMLPQYKTSNLPQSATAPSPYSFNTSGANSGISYEDLLNSQFKDNNHLSSYQQQAENPSMWPPQGPNNSRVPSGNAYYGFPGHQSQQPPGFRHSQQQPSQQEQQFEGHGYVSPYHSSLEHQNARDAPKQSQQQLWQNNY